MKPEEYDRLRIESARAIILTPNISITTGGHTIKPTEESAYQWAEYFLSAGGYTRDSAPEWTMVCCPWGHTFYRLPDHPTKINEPRCPHCMAKELDSAPSVVEPMDEDWIKAARNELLGHLAKSIAHEAYCLASERAARGME